VSDLERCIDFISRMADRAANRKEPSPYGVALLDPDLPRVWSRNFLLANIDREDASAAKLAGETDRLLAGVGARHRKVEVFDGGAGARLEPGFRALGWNAECDVIMVARRDPDRLVDTSIVDEVTVDDLVPTWTEGWRTDPDVLGEEVTRQLVENKRLLGSVVDTRFFAARVADDVASYCELYSDGSTAQIENVLTLERFRNRGLARATVSRALEEARDGAHDLVFLIADRDDWPKELYAKLGFDEVGHIWEFVLPRASGTRAE
jgi:GNAT superfamily N-acetyltransferase